MKFDYHLYDTTHIGSLTAVTYCWSTFIPLWQIRTTERERERESDVVALHESGKWKIYMWWFWQM